MRVLVIDDEPDTRELITRVLGECNATGTRALRAGFLVHLSKPVEPSELVATVASIGGRT